MKVAHRWLLAFGLLLTSAIGMLAYVTQAGFYSANFKPAWAAWGLAAPFALVAATVAFVLLHEAPKIRPRDKAFLWLMVGCLATWSVSLLLGHLIWLAGLVVAALGVALAVAAVVVAARHA